VSVRGLCCGLWYIDLSTADGRVRLSGMTCSRSNEPVHPAAESVIALLAERRTVAVRAGQLGCNWRSGIAQRHQATESGPRRNIVRRLLGKAIDTFSEINGGFRSSRDQLMKQEHNNR